MRIAFLNGGGFVLSYTPRHDNRNGSRGAQAESVGRAQPCLPDMRPREAVSRNAGATATVEVSLT